MNISGIDKRVWKAVVVDQLAAKGQRTAGPALVALAASACPELLDEDIEWKPYASLLLTERSDIAHQCGTPELQIRNVLGEWVMSQESARTALEGLARWDKKLSVWCSCAVSESALEYVPAGIDVDTAFEAIETTRAWVRGRAGLKKVKSAGANAVDSDAFLEAVSEYQRSYIGASASERTSHKVYHAVLSCFDSSRAAWSTSVGAYEKTSASHAASAATAHTVSFGMTGWNSRHDLEMRRLRKVVAAAIISYPSGDTIASRGLAANRALAAGLAGAALGASAMYAIKSRSK